MVKSWDFNFEWSRFSWGTVKVFMMIGGDFHDERSGFSWWTVQILMLNGRDFHVERSRFSWWTVKIFMMNGPNFHNDRWWQVEIFIIKVPELLHCFGLNPGARGDESKAVSFCFWCYRKEWRKEVSSRFPCITAGDWELLHSLFASQLMYLVFVECL